MIFFYPWQNYKNYNRRNYRLASVLQLTGHTHCSLKARKDFFAFYRDCSNSNYHNWTYYRRLEPSRHCVSSLALSTSTSNEMVPDPSLSNSITCFTLTFPFYLTPTTCAWVGNFNILSEHHFNHLLTGLFAVQTCPLLCHSGSFRM